MNERLRSELDYCVPLGIPHSRFLAWSQDDQDKALAYLEEMAKVCPGCHTRQSEWDEDPDAYIGDMRTCPGCERLEQEEANKPEGAKGVKLRLLPKKLALALVESYAERGGGKQ